MDFDHVSDDFPAGKAVIDAVGSLAFPIADVGTEIPCSMAAGLLHPFAHFFHKGIQMSASGMAVSESAFDNNLRFL